MSIEIINREAVPTSGFWYDLFNVGYFNPENFCKNAIDQEKVRDAMNTIIQYQKSLDDSGRIEWL